MKEKEVINYELKFGIDLGTTNSAVAILEGEKLNYSNPEAIEHNHLLSHLKWRNAVEKLPNVKSTNHYY